MNSTSESVVILLHGLARSERSMAKMARALNDAGYLTINQAYSSTRHPVERLAQDAIETALDRCPKQATIHFVTHSMGGILVRQYLSRNNLEHLGRVVMLGPPNRGSQIVDKIGNMPLFKWINGPAGLQLGTGELSVPNRLGNAHFELGIIAGTRSINPMLSAMLPPPNDGKVTVENTKLEGMTDHITLEVTHPFMMRNRDVIEQVLHFLQHGIFKKTE